MFYSLKEARNLVKKGEAIFYKKDVLWIRLGKDTIRVCSWNSGLKGYTRCFLSKEKPENLDFLFTEFASEGNAKS